MDQVEYMRLLQGEPYEKELYFTQQEFDERVAKVRAEMGADGLDGLIVVSPANLHYLSGYYTFSIANLTALILPADGDAGVVTASCEIPAAILSGWVEDVESFAWNEGDLVASKVASMLEARGLGSKRVGVEVDRGGPVPDLVESLRNALPNASFVNASGLVERVRVIKSEKELEYMREAGRMSVAGANASLRAIAPGVTDNDLAEVGYSTIIGSGSEFMSTPPIVTTGQRASWHHTTFRRLPMKQGEVAFFEYSGCYHRYNAPIMRTGVLGEPSEDLRRIGDAVKTTLDLVIEGAKAGRTAHDVASDALKGGYAGLEDEVWFMGICGYSVGAGFPPTWADGGTLIAEGKDYELEAGMTFHLPIMFRVPRRFGVGLSETIAITEDGCEVLTEESRELYVARG